MSFPESSRYRFAQQWQLELGPFLTVEDLAEALEIPCAEVRILARWRRILELLDEAKTPLYPVFSLGASNRPTGSLWIHQALGDVLAALARSCEEPWLWAVWLSGWNPKHRGCPPVELIQERPARVLELARNEDWSWTASYF